MKNTKVLQIPIQSLNFSNPYNPFHFKSQSSPYIFQSLESFSLQIPILPLHFAILTILSTSHSSPIITFCNPYNPFHLTFQSNHYILQSLQSFSLQIPVQSLHFAILTILSTSNSSPILTFYNPYNPFHLKFQFNPYM